MEDFDKLWDYGDPAGTEAKFRELLPKAEVSGNPSYHLQLLTQIARAQGIQERFDDAHATLREVRGWAPDDATLVRIRERLEQGRVFNSAGQSDKGVPAFKEALVLAAQHAYLRYAIDAVHMLGIAAATPEEQIEWNLRGIEMVEKNPSQKHWLWSLYNNLGESYAKAGDYRRALETFRKLAAFHTEQGREVDIYNLKDQARMLRLMGRTDEAMSIVGPIFERLDRESAQDGWITQEYAELLLLSCGAEAARPHFERAYALLSQDAWVRRHERAMLDRLKTLGGVET